MTTLREAAMTLTRPVWRKSRHSTEGTSAQCVEVAKIGGVVGVRDSKNPQVGHLTLPRESFATLVQRIKGRA